MGMAKRCPRLKTVFGASSLKIDDWKICPAKKKACRAAIPMSLRNNT